MKMRILAEKSPDVSRELRYKNQGFRDIFEFLIKTNVVYHRADHFSPSYYPKVSTRVFSII
jgi:hypothetical protein